ncbi:MAG: DUF3592 domain-containing protein [Myxococcota bacterium]
MSDPKQRGSLAFAFGLLAFGVGVVAYCVWDVSAVNAQATWPQVNAAITAIKDLPRRNSDGAGSCSFVVHYRYEVEGKAYDGIGGASEPAYYGVDREPRECAAVAVVGSLVGLLGLVAVFTPANWR